MDGRELLAEADVDFDPETVGITDGDVLDSLDPVVQEWWVEQFGEFVPENEGFFTPPQKEAIPHIHAGRNALVCAPTGSGKTLASFTAILDDLFRRERAAERADKGGGDSDHNDAGLDNSVYCLYVSPLKSLANDIHRNLDVPLSEITQRLEDRGEDAEVRHAIRHGDTDSTDRQRMLDETPHILNTTPETLAILLNAPKFREKLRTVEYVIVDEIHSIAGGKRGTHLAVSLERLEALAETSPTRIGCSATVEPLDTIAEFLVGRRADGESRDYEIVDARFAREFDLELRCPTDDLIDTPRGEVQGRFYDALDGLIDEHTNTLVFTNTRSGAERVLHTLREEYGYDESDSGCHHGSLATLGRQTAVVTAGVRLVVAVLLAESVENALGP